VSSTREVRSSKSEIFFHISSVHLISSPIHPREELCSLKKCLLVKDKWQCILRKLHEVCKRALVSLNGNFESHKDIN
jgi:hypothetical protein